ncbi:response regulator [Proteiniborus sp. MB09-C3]|uniref:response regulator n=1 Tax=Proteiniborus sp. MB09-C3 TaxID=3050072 RepID=UPI002554EEE5|nr:response regulator [Proteiniborus sp. MB09-C3]WIV12235.1 response regulator [Proteiniborus sp. MB09-C3]
MKPKVLCVDDQYGIRVLLKEILKSDYEVMTVETGEEAIENVQEFDPQVVILDMKLEKMKGTEVLKSIKQINCSIGTIILTGYQDYDLINEIKQSNPEKIIIKPFEVEQIKNSVKEIIEKSTKGTRVC